MTANATFVQDKYTIFLGSLKMVSPYQGLIEGDPKKITEMMRRLGRITSDARRTLGLPDHAPFFLQDPGSSPLPDCLWLGYFRSRTPVDTVDVDYESELYVAWYSDELPENLPAAVARALEQVDWQQQAQDCNLFDRA